MIELEKFTVVNIDQEISLNSQYYGCELTTNVYDYELDFIYEQIREKILSEICTLKKSKLTNSYSTICYDKVVIVVDDITFNIDVSKHLEEALNNDFKFFLVLFKAQLGTTLYKYIESKI